jgi:twinkle protein
LPASKFSEGSPAKELLVADASSYPSEGLRARRITQDTMRKYGVFLGAYSGGRRQVYPYYDMQGNLVVQKLRFPDKSFVALKAEGAPGLGKCQLFGRHVYGDKFDRQVIITEGELDALSVAQAIDFKSAAVSINTGAGNAADCLKANYLWLDRFEDIVLWFDDDDPGRAAAEECAKLFKVGKVRLAKAVGYKDASDVLQADKPGDIKSVLYAAAKWRPRGIVNANERGSAIMAPREKVLAYNYPPQMPKLQEMTGGLHLGDVIYHVAGTGVGKSTSLREIQYHLVEQGVKIAILSFEDTLRDAMMGLMSIKENCRLHLLPVPDPEDTEALAAYDKRMLQVHGQVFGTGLVELFDPETAEWKMEAIMSYVRYVAKALECKVVFLDPLSFVASGIDLTADERRVLDMVAGEFAKMVKELDIHLEISHHLKRTQGIPHEEGAPTSLNELRSSGGLANFAMGVIGWERNNQAAGEGWRVTQSRIIKPIRKMGKTGIADVLYYNEDGRLIPSPIPFPPMGKPSDGDDDHSPTKGFRPVGSADY